MRDWKSILLVPGLCFFFGIFSIAASFLIPPSSPDFARRWLVFLFGIMAVLIGALQLSAVARTRLSAEAAAIFRSIAVIVVYGIFAAMLLAGGLMNGDELRGGFWFLPHAVNSALGRVLFVLVGGILALMVVANAVGLVLGILRRARGRR